MGSGIEKKVFIGKVEKELCEDMGIKGLILELQRELAIGKKTKIP
jgi:hypothetical protein